MAVIYDIDPMVIFLAKRKIWIKPFQVRLLVKEGARVNIETMGKVSW